MGSNLTKLKKGILKIFIRMLHVFPVNKKKILISNFWGKGLGDSPKAIALELLYDTPDYKIYWVVKEGTTCTFPKGITPVHYRSLQYFFHLATAKIWIDNVRKSNYVIKKKSQYYIQLWHGDPMLKKIEKDAENTLSSFYLEWAKHDSKIINLIISNSDFGTDFFKKSFWYEGNIYKAGAPRLDILKDPTPETIARIYDKLHINQEKKILLYAPTFRADHNINCYAMDYNKLKLELTKRFGGDWVILVRLHPNMTFVEVEALNITYSDWLVNASYYDDMYELLCVSEILITDYSSTIFEAACVQKPVFLYATDCDYYLRDRGFYFNYESLPFPIAKSFDDLLVKVDKFDLSVYINDVTLFCKSLGMVEPGKSSKRIVKLIKQIK